MDSVQHQSSQQTVQHSRETINSCDETSPRPLSPIGGCSGYHHVVHDYFRATGKVLFNEGVNFLWAQKQSMPEYEKELDAWTKRPGGSYTVGNQNRAFFKRIIVGADLKNQAGSSITAASGFVQYLNLSQLLQIKKTACSFADWSKTTNQAVKGFGVKVEESIGEQALMWILTRPFAGREAEVVPEFSAREKRFLGRRVIIHIGALSHLTNINHSFNFEPKGSVWYAFVVKSDEGRHNCDDTVGVFVEYPSLRGSQTRSAKRIYCLAESQNFKGQEYASDWHVLGASKDHSLSALIEVARNFKGTYLKGATDKQSRGAPKLLDMEALEENELSTPSTTSPLDDIPSDDTNQMVSAIEADVEEEAELQRELEMSNAAVDEGANPTETELKKIAEDMEGYWGEDGYFYYYDPESEAYYREEEADAQEAGAEANYTLYWDPYLETYVYYEHAVYFDAENELFYVHNEAEDEYYYLDEETQALLYSGDVPTWDYDAAQWEVEVVDDIPEGYYLAEDGYYYPIETEGADIEEEAAAQYTSQSTPAEAEEEPGPPTLEDHGTQESHESLVNVAHPGERESKVTPEEVKDNKQGNRSDKKRLESQPQQLGEAATQQEKSTTEQKPGPTEDKPGTVEEKPTSIGEQLSSCAEQREPIKQEDQNPYHITVLIEQGSKDENKDQTSAWLTKLPSDSRTVSKMDLPKPKAKVRVAAKSPLPKATTNRIVEQFKASEGMLTAGAMPVIQSEFENQTELLNVWEKRPNGQFKVGDAKKVFTGLMKGTAELKALSSLCLSTIASSMNSLNLAQLVQIRSMAQNSAWDRSPQSGMKVFAMKADALIAENLILHMLANTLHADACNDPSEYLKQMKTLELRFMGTQAIFVLGSASHLKIVTDRDTWWYVPSSPGSTVVPKCQVTEKPTGVFLNPSRLYALFDRPLEVEHVYRLSPGRANAGFIQWDVVQVPLLKG